MKTKITAFLSIVLIACALASCAVNGPSEGGGALTITFASEAYGARTLLPDIDMNIASYEVSGSGPSGQTFSVTTSAASVVQSNLLPGSWTVTVNARNAEAAIIGTGSGDATVVNDVSTPLTVNVTPITGDGTFSLDLTWPATRVTSPVVNALLTPLGGSATALTLTMGSGSATYSATHPAGYYTLTLQLLDGATVVWGKTEGLRIVAGGTTAAAAALTEGEINFGGELVITITAQMNNPLTVTVASPIQKLSLGDDLTATATFSATPDTIQWYLNGEAVSGATSDSISIGSALTIGAYRLDILAVAGTTLCSGGVSFQVIDAEPLIQLSELRLSSSPYVEIRNTGLTDCDLTGWTLRMWDAGTLAEDSYTIGSLGIPAGGYIAFQSGTGTATATVKYTGVSWYWYYSSSEYAAVLDDGGQGVDFVRINASAVEPPTGTAWSGGGVAPSSSNYYIRRSSTTDTDAAADWVLGNVGTPGAPN